MRRKTHKEFIQDVYDKYGDEYEIMNEYIDSKTHVLCRHTICGYEWMNTPSNLLRKGTCPKCNKRVKKDTKYFLNEMSEKYGDDYTVLSEYINNRTKVKIRHNVCGHEFDIIPTKILTNAVCHKCNKRMIKDTEYFKKELLDLSSGSYVLISEYSGAYNNVEVLHIDCGKIFENNPTGLLNGAKCTHCYKPNNIKKTTEEFSEEILEKYNGNFLVVGNYIDSKTPIEFEHIECHTRFTRTPDNALRDLNCSNIDCKRKNNKMRRTTEDFQKELDLMYKGEYLVEGEYINNVTKIDIRHIKCDKVWEAYPCNVLKGHECLYCFGRYQLDNDSFKEKLQRETDGEYELVSEYTKARDKTLFKHATCGTVFECTPDHLLNADKKCPNCSDGLSKGEAIIFEYLSINEIDFKSQKSIEGCKHINHLPFDFAVYNDIDNLLLLIEYDGKQHFEPIDFFGGEEAFESTKMRDRIKNTYCKENNIPLLRIPYWDFDNIEEILYNELNKYNLIKH